MFSSQAEERLLKRIEPNIGLRIIPKPLFEGCLGFSDRLYVCIGDYEELRGKPLHRVVSMLYGHVGRNDEKKLKEVFGRWCNTKGGGFIEHIADKDDRHFAMNEYDQFYVIKIDLSHADELDLFPGTWKAVAFIACDSRRMAGELALHQTFMQVVRHRNPFEGMVKERIDFYELNAISEEESYTANPQFHYYSFLTEDSGFADDLLRPFGIYNRCWHGRGYVGYGGLVACRVFLVRNLKLREDCIIGCRLMSRNEILDW